MAMLAGALLTLRLIPRLASLVEKGAFKRLGLVSALGGWQVGRRAGSFARAGLLLILALCVGLFSLAFMHTWQVSQADQADFQVGADIRVQPRTTSGVIPAGWLPSAYRSLDEVEVAMPYSRTGTSIPGAGGVATIVLLDSARADGVVHFREDLADESFGTLMDKLAANRTDVAAIALPGEPTWLAIDMWFELESLCPEEDPDQPCRRVRGLTAEEVASFDAPITLAVVVRDAAGGLRRIEAGPLAGGGEIERVIFDLAPPEELQDLIALAWPLELVAIEFSTLAAPIEGRTGGGGVV